ncbi:MAG: ankyrin repeat domain-containing protein, partial [Gemmatimonadales bacterium]
ADGAQPDAEEITHGLWSSCHGGQRETAQFFLEQGGNINWVGYDDLTPLGAARRSGAGELVGWLEARGAKSA